MASEETRKKFGTIFMGQREASVEQLNAMQEPLRREQKQKEDTEDYMERVRARAADRAREILGAAYTERQKVLDEAKVEAEAIKRAAAQEGVKLKAEGETARKMGQAELEKAREVRMEAERIRDAAHGEGFQAGMDQATSELHEFRAELGHAVGSLLHAIERQRKNLMDGWREDLTILAQCASQAGSGYLLRTEHEDILRAMVHQALDLLENRGTISVRVNPEDEERVSDMFRAARERFPELKQWIVTGDDSIEPGGLVAESGTGSVDLRRQNFRAMVDGVLAHLAFPEGEYEAEDAEFVRDLVEREVAHIASLTPEMDMPEEPVPAPADDAQAQDAPQGEAAPENAAETESGGEESAVAEDAAAPAEEAAADDAALQAEEQLPAELPPDQYSEDAQAEAALPDDLQDAEDFSGYEGTAAAAFGDFAQEPSLEELEEELFPVEDALAQVAQALEETEPAAALPEQPHAAEIPETPAEQENAPEAADAKTLSEGGFL